jgi:hypothetical protein
MMTAAKGPGDELARAVEHAVSLCELILRWDSRYEGNTLLRTFLYGKACVSDFEALPVNERSVFQV